MVFGKVSSSGNQDNQYLSKIMPKFAVTRQKTDKKRKNTEKRDFKPALHALNSLVEELEHSENLDGLDGIVRSERERQTPSSVAYSANDFSYNCNKGRSRDEGTRKKTVSPLPLFKRDWHYEEFDRDEDSKDDLDDCEERTKVRALTEIERLEEAQTELEERVKHVQGLLNRRDRTRNQRLQGQRTLERLEAKLEMLDQRLEYERSGKNQWTYVRKELKKPRVGFHSSDLLNRNGKVGVKEASPFLEEEAEQGGVIFEEEQELEEKEKSKSEESQFEMNSQPLKPRIEKMLQTKELEDFHASLEENKAAESNPIKTETKENDSGRELKGARKMEYRSYRKEIDKGWLRISDRPKDFVKKVDDSETDQFKEAWENVNQQEHQLFARRVFRSHVSGINPLQKGKISSDARKGGNLQGVNDEGVLSGLCETCYDTKAGRVNENVTGRSSPSRLQRSQFSSLSQPTQTASRLQQRPSISKIKGMVERTHFLPPISNYEAKRLPKEDQVKTLKHESDDERKKVRFLLLPNQKRLAKRRAELYVKQLAFAKSHGLDHEDVWKNADSAIQEHCGIEELLSEHEVRTNPRSTLYLIGALSKDHVHAVSGKASVRS